MKFTVLGSNQRKAVEFGLDLKDLVIIEWMQKFWPKMKKKIIDGKEYGWVKYDALLKDYPLLEINAKKVLYRRMKAMEDLGILDHRGVKDETGSFSYYRLTEKVLELIDDEYSDGGGTESPTVKIGVELLSPTVVLKSPKIASKSPTPWYQKVQSKTL